MDFYEWAEGLSEEQRNEFESLDESEVAEYLSNHDIALPDELLEEVAGGINPFLLLGQALKRMLGNR